VESLEPQVEKIVSGGQTGADRAALDFAITQAIPYGGWCPKGRKAEDGSIPGQYQLVETPRADYLQRNEWNVRDTDGTVIFTVSDTLSGGSRRTAEFAQQHGKPCLHLSEEVAGDGAAVLLLQFIEQKGIRVLNVAGSRWSKEAGVAAFVERTLMKALVGNEAA